MRPYILPALLMVFGIGIIQVMGWRRDLRREADRRFDESCAKRGGKSLGVLLAEDTRICLRPDSLIDWEARR